MAIENIVRVTAEVSAGASADVDFGRTLLLHPVSAPTTADEAEAFVQGWAVYTSQAALGEDWDSTSEPAKAGAIYFQQQPFPRALVVAPILTEDVHRSIFGAEVDVTGGAASDATLTFADVTREVDLATAVTGTDVATEMQDAFLRAPTGTESGDLITGITFTSSGTGSAVAFTVQLPMDSSISSSVFAESFSGTGAMYVGLDDAQAFAFDYESESDEPSGQSYAYPEEALSRILTDYSNFYFVALSNEVETNINDRDNYEARVTAVSSWCAANQRGFGFDDNDTSTLSGTATTLLGELSDMNSPYVFGFWSREKDYKALSMAARFSSINFNVVNSLITGKFKSLPGCTPDDQLTGTQVENLLAQRINVYNTVGGRAIVRDGFSFGPNGWIDVQYWLSWFILTCQSELYSLLLTSRRLPQTAAGAASIHRVLTDVCNTGVTNGGIAPGQLSESLANDIRATTTNSDFDGFLSTGFLVHIPPFSTQSLVDRQARKSTPPNVWLKGSGAVHSIEVVVRFEQ